MEPTKVDPVACARLIVYNRVANGIARGLYERDRAAIHSRSTAEAAATMTLDDLIAREMRNAGCTDRNVRPLIPPNVALMIASIASSVAVVLWCIGAR